MHFWLRFAFGTSAGGAQVRLLAEDHPSIGHIPRRADRFSFRMTC